ncbi:MAG TPA: hypothetical protein VKB95_15280, partial [Chitinophagaceae bacterium]|nr:hypothetical protein [Chitinophagaceae bacterium]
AQDRQINETANQTKVLIEEKQKLNFFVVSKRKKGKLDPATRFNVLRSKIKSLFRPKNFVAIVAPGADHASVKILHRLEKYNASIGTIWFDSHGAYRKGYSLFYIGHDEINYENLVDSSFKSSFELLTPYSTSETKLVIGSCYGGATYIRASIDYKDTTRMNGDSLMMALGKIFPQARIYGSESWVMTKPGIFNDNKVAVAGFPKRKLFRDVCYQPAWERMGKWNEYNAAANTFIAVNPVTLDSYGNVEIARQAFNIKDETQKDILKNITRLATGLYK